MDGSATVLTDAESALDARIGELFAGLAEMRKAGDMDGLRLAWTEYARMKNRRTVEHQNKLSAALGLPIALRAA